MIAYKVFTEKNNKLYSAVCFEHFNSYSKTLINTRPDNCGPFACFLDARQASRFLNDYLWAGKAHRTHAIYSVKIKQSKATRLWLDNGEINLFPPPGTVYADEFQILERVI